MGKICTCKGAQAAVDTVCSVCRWKQYVLLSQNCIKMGCQGIVNHFVGDYVGDGAIVAGLTTVDICFWCDAV